MDSPDSIMSFTHERNGNSPTDIWLTPPEIIRDLGPFDLDPCAAPEPRPWPTAARMISLPQDGLYAAWAGLVWLNAPYGEETGDWLARLARHDPGGIALTFARTETAYFFDHAWAAGAGFYFLRGRINFLGPDGRRRRGARGDLGRSGAPSVLIGYGDEGLRRLARSKLGGHLLVNARAVLISPDDIPMGTWQDAVGAALAGRTLRLRDIYAAAEGTPKVRIAKAEGHNWQAQIRRALQVYFRPIETGVWSAA
jgi:hypothetical protein